MMADGPGVFNVLRRSRLQQIAWQSFGCRCQSASEATLRYSTTSIIKFLQSVHSNVRLSTPGPAGSISRSHMRALQLSHFGSSNNCECGIEPGVSIVQLQLNLARRP
jgi:hypothetical protein